MQGNPDPYSAFSQGLTGGVNTGMNIMQMIQQKAQAARQNSLSSFASGAAIMKDPDLAAMHENAYEMMKNSWSELNPKSEFPSYDSFGDKGRAKRVSGIMDKFADNPKMQFEALNAEFAGASKETLDKYDPYLKTLEKQATTQERERKISGIPATPGLAAPTVGYNPNFVKTPNTMYGLTGDVPSTQAIPGLRSLAQDAKMSPLETESMLADYRETGKFNLPKDEKAPYPIGSRQKFSKDGKPFEGTYQGTSPNKEPTWSDVQETKDWSRDATERSLQGNYLRLKGLFDNNDVVKYATNSLQAVPYLTKAYEQYKKTGEAGVLDQALIVNQGKISDQASAVLIGEFLISKGMQSLWQKAEGSVAKLVNSSAGLSPEYREQLYEAVMYALENKKAAYDQQVDSARADAAELGVSEDRIKKAFPYSNERFKINKPSNDIKPKASDFWKR